MSFLEKRKQPFSVDQEKFATQRGITYLLILIFACVVTEVLWRNVETERSTVLQTVINLTMLAVGYWLGASKQGQDTAQAMSDLAKAAPAAAKEATDEAKKAADKTIAVALGQQLPPIVAEPPTQDTTGPVTPAQPLPDGTIPAAQAEQLSNKP